MELSSHPIQAETPTRAKPEIYQQTPSNRGSIKFLLNSGTDSFTETFRLPPHSDRALSLNYHRSGLRELQRPEKPSTVNDRQSECCSRFFNSDQTTPQFFQESFLGFLNGPFGDGQRFMKGSCHTNDIDYQTVHLLDQDNINCSPRNPPVPEASLEPERPFAVALIQSILSRSWQILTPKDQEEVSANLYFLLTTARVRKYIKLYFKYWQPSCAMLEISFDPETVPLPLLAAVAFMGAIYSDDQRETCLARRVLDLAELFIFSNEVFSAESEICTVFSGGQHCDQQVSDWVRFQNLQAGFIMVIVQYWAGNRMARNRAVENRFSEVVKVARRIELVKARHASDEQEMEHMWIQKECRIRYVSFSLVGFPS